MSDAALAASRFIARKNRRSRQFISELTPWSPSLSVNEGDVVSSFDAAWMAQSGGVTGTIAPTIGTNDVSFDGAIYWTRQWRLLVMPPTPTP